MTKTTGRNILISGATGMIGSKLTSYLSNAGFTVFALNRRSSYSPFRYQEHANEVILDPNIPLRAVINLAGPSIADRRWTQARKSLLLSSRVNLTKALATAIATLPVKPALFLSASAVGYYGQTGHESVSESSPPGDDFLASVAKHWESATAPAELADVNTIHLRLGVVLSTEGGMLKQLLRPFKLGLGGRIGNGSQYLSWISIQDVLTAVTHLIQTNPRSGPLNLVSGKAVTNSEFCSQLAQALHRPCRLPLPAPIARLLFGEMADALLLGSSRVHSEKLDALGVKLAYPTIDKALHRLLQT